MSDADHHPGVTLGWLMLVILLVAVILAPLAWVWSWAERERAEATLSGRPSPSGHIAGSSGS